MHQNEFQVNYIRHLSGVLDKFAQDKRLTPCHISLYIALFQFWNMSRFVNPISINRAEIMEISKIGSANTYTKCLKELDKFGYIQYLPSYSPLRGSLVNLYNFDNSTDKGSDNSSDKGRVIAVRPSINNKKHIKQLNNLEEEKNSSSHKQGKMSIKKSKSNQFVKPSFEIVKEHFKEKNFPELEAQKFFNHFESNGWLVSGKTPMKNWQAAARNWMLNHEKFKSPFVPKNKLSTDPDKNYSEPL